MKFILRPIWNYLIGCRNGYYPQILWEHIPQYPIKFWCSVLWVYRKTNTNFAMVYVDDRNDTEITHDVYWGMYKTYLKDKEKWYQKQFEKNNTKKEKRILKIHYWLNNLKRWS